MSNDNHVPPLNRVAAALLGCSLLGLTGAGWAQDGALALEEVIVTAQKREQSLQDVPISVSAFNLQKLEVMGIDELEDIGVNVPNLFLNSFNNDPTTVRLFIRGIGQNDVQLTQDPSVALYVDGVYVGTSIGSGIETVALERIEVLRGPQGTLYGRNATGGAVNMISQRPDTEEWGFRQLITAGDYDLLKSRTSLNIPLNGKAGIKLAYLQSKRDGLIQNLGEGPDWAIEDRQAWRIDLSYPVTDKLMLDYGYDKSELEDTSRLEFIHGAVNPFGLAAFSTEPTPGRPSEATSSRPLGDSTVEVFGHNLTLSWVLSDTLEIKSITGYREVDSNVFHDGTPTVGITFLPDFSGSPASSSERWTDFEQLTQEFQFLGSAIDGRLEYVAGLYYYEDESEQMADGFSVLGPRNPNDFTSSENESLAVFGQFTFTPASAHRWHFTLGARYSEDQRQAFRINENSETFAALGGYTLQNCTDFYFAGTACPPAANATVQGANYDKEFENFNPSFTVAFDATEDVNVYAKVVTGYKSGGTSQRSANPTAFGNGFDEEEITAWELGLKGLFLDSRLSFNAAAFYMEVDGFQASVQTGATAGDRDFTPIDENEIAGLEMDLTALLLENLELSLSYGYLDTEMGVDTIETLTATGEVQITHVVPEISYAPESSWTAALNYRIFSNYGDWNFHLNYAYQDGAVTSLNVFDNLPTDDRGLLDANITLSNLAVGSGRLRLSLWGKNLTDEEYIIVNTSSLTLVPGVLELSPWTTWGDPSTYGFTMEYVY
ncbi:MAG: TonB-dependent receptor [Halieaceae bacterium]|nr:TonB-dependent receptor [Halieaceae bacterium]